ncbi:MAG TPA: histidine kinase [Streptosporangiaceae bacterium]|nr:histidine kinase [Streptosporangiaceae bacterium]
MARRRRLEDLAWGAGLVGCALAVMRTLPPSGPHSPWELLLPLAAVVAALLAPRVVRRVLPVVLILLGIYGLVITDYAYDWSLSGGHYAMMSIGSYDTPAWLVLTLAYGCLGLGGWLAWRTADRRSELGRLVFGRLAEPERRWHLLAFLLVPVALVGVELLWPRSQFRGSPLGLLLLVAVLVGAHLLATRRPELAVRAAAVGLIIVGVAGAAAAMLAGRASAPVSFAVSPGHPAHPVPQPSVFLIDGLIVLTGTAKSAANLVAVLQGLALTGFGLALTPVAFAPVGRLVGLSADGELTRRVQRLTESRAVVVDTAAADLRRLERDLHDGAQARLVALGMNLRAAERLIAVSPDAAAALVAEARETSARALTELRELVRGVHPPVLADRGLGDALRALALDTPMKINVDVDLPGRLPAPVETACYFAVAEVLTNAVKHSGARVGQVSATHADGLLRITVTDFGVGGADPARGTGLAGIEKRLAAFDGVVAVSSPVGGPTMVVMELPCASSSPTISS